MKLTRNELRILEQLLERSIDETCFSIKRNEIYGLPDLVAFWENILKEEESLLLKIIKELEEGRK